MFTEKYMPNPPKADKLGCIVQVLLYFIFSQFIKNRINLTHFNHREFEIRIQLYFPRAARISKNKDRKKVQRFRWLDVQSLKGLRFTIFNLRFLFR